MMVPKVKPPKIKLPKLKNSQKLVFTGLAFIAILELGLSSKLQSLWNLAFTGTADNSQQTPWWVTYGYNLVQGGVTPKTGPCANLRGEALHVCLQNHGLSGEGPIPPGSIGRPLTEGEKNQVKQNAGGVEPDAHGHCPIGYGNLGGICVPNSVLGQI